MNTNSLQSTTPSSQMLRRNLAAATLGWGLDGMDFAIFVFAIGALQKEFGFGPAYAGLIMTTTVLCSALGGILFGVLADRFGRARMLSTTIFIFSFASLGSATAQTPVQLLLWRALLGLGMGGEWAMGATLVGETWPKEKRDRAMSIMQSGWAFGYITAALLARFLIPTLGWRALFVAGFLPALVAIWIRQKIEEPEAWQQHHQLNFAQAHTPNQARRSLVQEIFAPVKTLLSSEWRWTAIIAAAMVASVMCGAWGLFTWIPGYLATPVEQGGAGLSFIKSTEWVISLQAGAACGYLTFFYFAKRFGRREAFAGYLVMAAVLGPIYVMSAGNPVAFLVLGPIVGFVGHGFFSAFGGLFAEIFPVSMRATAQSTVYNIGRGVSSAAPWVIGALAERFGFAVPLSCAAGFYLLGALFYYALPNKPQTDAAASTDDHKQASSQLVPDTAL